MADKEERILIARSTDYTITDTDEGALFDGKIAPHCANVFTRQEVIERMAKAIYTFEIVACSHDECGNKQCENCETWKWCENIAEAALNSLLEKHK